MDAEVFFCFTGILKIKNKVKKTSKPEIYGSFRKYKRKKTDF